MDKAWSCIISVDIFHDYVKFVENFYTLLKNMAYDVVIEKKMKKIMLTSQFMDIVGFNYKKFERSLLWIFPCN